MTQVRHRGHTDAGPPRRTTCRRCATGWPRSWPSTRGCGWSSSASWRSADPCRRRPSPSPVPAEEALRELAERARASGWFRGPCTRADGDHVYNTASVIDPEGEVVGRYRKMFPFEPYEIGISAGDEFLVFDVPDVGRFGLVHLLRHVDPGDLAHAGRDGGRGDPAPHPDRDHRQGRGARHRAGHGRHQPVLRFRHQRRRRRRQRALDRVRSRGQRCSTRPEAARS